jgi:hypothetical protein
MTTNIGDVVRCKTEGHILLKKDKLYKVLIRVDRGVDYLGEVFNGYVVQLCGAASFDYPYVWDVSHFEKK